MRTFVFTCLLLLGMTTFAQDANFHIYLCLGQSNMEGNAKVEEQDTVAGDRRSSGFWGGGCLLLSIVLIWGGPKGIGIRRFLLWLVAIRA